MDRYGMCRSLRLVLALLAAVGICSSAAEAEAQQARRLVRNPITGRLEPLVVPERVARRAAVERPVLRGMQPVESQRASAEPMLRDELVEPTDYIDAPCDDFCCDIGCGDAVCGVPDDCTSCGCPDECSSCGCPDDCCECYVPCAPRCRPGGFFAGFEAVVVQPRFGTNEAFSVMTGNGGGFESFTSTEFDYAFEFAPRVHAGWQNGNGVGFRAAWWQFDHAAATAATNPPANGFGRVDHPDFNPVDDATFGDIDISSTDPDDVFTADAAMNVYAIDLEFTKSTSFTAWDLGVSCGFRYASAEQSYQASLVDSVGNVLRGSLDYTHKLDGYGPTVSMEAYRRVYSDAGIFCKARGSALFGDGTSRLVAGEDLDLSTAFTTTRTTRRDDLLPVGELQVGFRWQGAPRRGQVFRPVVSIAMESQVWHGAGNASSEDGSLGFYGMNAGVGANW